MTQEQLTKAQCYAENIAKYAHAHIWANDAGKEYLEKSILEHIQKLKELVE